MEMPLSTLIDPPELRALSRRSDRIGLTWLAGHLGLILSLCLLVVALRRSGHPWASVPAMAALGVAWVALFTPLHETTHRTPFESQRLNRAVGYFCGFALWLPPEGFRLFHMAHHRHTRDPVRDPELIGVSPLTIGGYLWRLSGLPYWRAQATLIGQAACGRVREPWVPEAARPRVVAESRAFLGGYAAIAAGAAILGSPWPVWLYLLPVLLGQPALRAVLMAEHGGLPRVSDRLVNTRTTRAGWIATRLFWNANYHAEHHLAPGVPFHALPRLHALLRPRLHAVCDGYAAAHAQIRADPARPVDGGGR